MDFAFLPTSSLKSSTTQIPSMPEISPQGAPPLLARVGTLFLHSVLSIYGGACAQGTHSKVNYFGGTIRFGVRFRASDESQTKPGPPAIQKPQRWIKNNCH
jgi:hypothetical protein